jgi:tRNA(Ile)-lysidine synthase
MKAMQDRVGIILRERCRLQPGDRMVLGVSGGADSLSLMDLFVRLGYSPVISHFDHQLRPGSGQDAAQVREWSDDLGLAFILGSQDVRAYAATLSLGCRETRYRFLCRAAEEVGATAVAVAHTADDQVETVLMHLLRGSGLAGLRGMAVRALPNPWNEEIALVRPLLSFWRAEILAYCADRGLQPRTDPTNQDPTFFRNRLRRELIPYLETFNPEIRRHGGRPNGPGITAVQARSSKPGKSAEAGRGMSL